jgi:hypothetical protein
VEWELYHIVGRRCEQQQQPAHQHARRLLRAPLASRRGPKTHKKDLAVSGCEGGQGATHEDKGVSGYCALSPKGRGIKLKGHSKGKLRFTTAYNRVMIMRAGIDFGATTAGGRTMERYLRVQPFSTTLLPAGLSTWFVSRCFQLVCPLFSPVVAEGMITM